jgi:cellulose synthase/poly-beta-1,6-N-acetylglucosamine synthase-like glycosyltransferase
MAEILFYTSLFLIFYGYFGYPLSLLFVSLLKSNSKRVTNPGYYPYVTLIITAHNEEKRIGKKLENTISLNYPKHKLQIIVASDGSTDKTNDIVKRYNDYGIELLEIGGRRGKENAQKEAVKKAMGEVIVFTDVATYLEPNALKQIVSNFADPSIGCVSSEDRLLGKNGKPGGEGFYVRYEMWLRRLESKVNSLVGLSGSFFAARKEVCQDFSGEMQSDFRTVLNSIKMGMKGVSDPKSIGYYQDVSDEEKEFTRKVRTVLRGLTVFFNHMEFLNFLKYGFFSYQYLCHKLLRWLVPVFLFIAFVSNFILTWKSYIFLGLFLAQLGFYVWAILGWKIKNFIKGGLLKIPVYFLIVNASIFVAWWKYLKGERVIMWTPSER